MKSLSPDDKKKKKVGYVITGLSLSAALVSTFGIGLDYVPALLSALLTGAGALIAYNVFAKRNGSWPAIRISDALTWIFIPHW